jgi:hypothetical protein
VLTAPSLLTRQRRSTSAETLDSPLFPHPLAPGHIGALSPPRHAPFQSRAPSLPLHPVHGTSWNAPCNAPCPLGKNTAAPPVSSQMSKWTGAPNWFVGEDCDCPHHASLLGAGQRSVTFTMIDWKGPV